MSPPPPHLIYPAHSLSLKMFLVLYSPFLRPGIFELVLLIIFETHENAQKLQNNNL